jgi:hypothetical protein
MRYAWAALVLSIVPGVACTTESGSPVTSADDVAEELADDRAPVLVKDPRTLVQLEEAGFSFSKVVTTAQMKPITDALTQDLDLMKRQDPKAGVGVENPHRLFDKRWFSSSQTRYELVGVVNRLDRATARAATNPGAGNCGELRLIYRLAYTAKRTASRLPMTVNVVFPQADDGQACQTVAQKWLDAKSGTADALAKGPLAALPPIGSIEVNLQSARWPSNERPEFGGHAEYILRVFRAEGATVVSVPLENTPRSNLAESEVAELKQWVADNVAAIDDGTAIVPEKFLASKAISIGPAGGARDANRPWTRLFPDATAAFGALPLGETQQVASPAALLRRLDTMSCNGCHQTRSIAGFHLLGEERDPTARANALAIGRSPHFEGELAWRSAYVEAVAKGTPYATPRPFAERTTSAGNYGAHCGLGDPGFAKWTCDAGLECLDLHGDVVGSCSPSNAPVGDACEVGKVTKSPNPRLDRVTDIRQLACNDGRGARCNPTSMGFPDGMCRLDCAADAVGSIVEDTICGEIPSAAGLTSCLAANKPFTECLATTSAPAFLHTCDRTNPCRDDYACTRVKNGPPGVGACMPPYFAFQARVDGHLLDN